MTSYNQYICCKHLSGNYDGGQDLERQTFHEMMCLFIPRSYISARLLSAFQNEVSPSRSSVPKTQHSYLTFANSSMIHLFLLRWMGYSFNR